MVRSMQSLSKILLLSTLTVGFGACQSGSLDAAREEEVPPPDGCSMPEVNVWLYDAMQRYYLWNDRLPDLEQDEIEGYESTELLLDDLRYADVDRWSRIREAQVVEDHYQKGRGMSFGHKTMRDEDDRKWITFVNDPSPAWEAGLRRGDEILEDGYLDEDRLFLGLTVRHPDGEEVQLELEKEKVSYATVPYEEGFEEEEERHGYLMFRTFVEPAIEALDEVFADYQTLGITKVIVDLRYNGGGLISVARHLGNLLVGLNNEGELSFTYKYNDDRADKDRNHYYETVDHSIGATEVVFIVGPGTASASELVINMVRPYVKTTIVGNTTAGKPVGMHSHDFCEEKYKLSPVEFRMINAEGYGDYYEGIEPDCVAEDDVTHELGTREEARIAEALTVLRTGDCSRGAKQRRQVRSRVVHDRDGLDRMPGALAPRPQ
ncbi:MAG: hypothetical protein B7733_20635 [Myxococcales bacterium FL481]|nr:MAG: hypothetical protein B7733_20635 [Myxococcales bacterium FL481]